MRRIVLLGLWGMMFCLVGKSLVLATDNFRQCSWCGIECLSSSMKRMCAEVMPPEGKSCVDVGEVCTIKDGYDDRITATTSCGPGNYWEATVVNDVRSMENVWEVVEDVKAGTKTIISYVAGWATDTVRLNSSNNYSFGGIRQGKGYSQKVTFVADGREYIVSAYTAPYTLDVPSFGRKLAEVRFSLTCPIPTLAQTQTDLNLIPTCTLRPACLDGDPRCMIPEPDSGWCPKSNSDANNDGRVDLIDFSIWKREYLENSAAALKTDFNKDGKADLFDFALWKNEYLSNLYDKFNY